MSSSTSSRSQQAATISSRKSIPGTQKTLRRVASKILQKMKLIKRHNKEEEDVDVGQLGSSATQDARSVTLTQPTEAPRIIDLAAATRPSPLPPPPPRASTHRSGASRPDTFGPSLSELCRLKSLENPRSPAESGIPLRKNSALAAFAPEASLDGETVALLDDAADVAGYDVMIEEADAMEWGMLDLPENVYGRLANESCHSLI